MSGLNKLNMSYNVNLKLNTTEKFYQGKDKL